MINVFVLLFLLAPLCRYNADYHLFYNIISGIFLLTYPLYKEINFKRKTFYPYIFVFLLLLPLIP